jgi:hypothetical protein
MWWHLAAGRRVLTHGVPTTDPFTYTALGRRWVTHEWLSEVVFQVLYRFGGVRLLFAFKAALAVGAVGLGTIAALIGPRSRTRVVGVAMGACLAAPLISLRAFVRPHMLTALLLGVLLIILRLESTDQRRRWRVLLIPLFLIWANLHSGFVLGLALVGLTWAGESLLGRPGEGRSPSKPVWRDRGIFLGLAFLATLANPNFLEAHIYPIRLLARSDIRESIVELRSAFNPAYRHALFLPCLAIAGSLSFLLLTDSRKRLDGTAILPGIAFGALALASIRGLSEFAVILPVLFGTHAERLGGRPRLAFAAALATIAGSISLGSLAIARGIPTGNGARQHITLRQDPGAQPVAAARFLKEVHPAGHVFNLLSYGGYLINALGPETPVYIDGRLDVFPPGFLGAYNRMLETGEGWESAVTRYGITFAVVNYVKDSGRDRGLRARLRNDPDWVCVLAGDFSLVYAKRTPENAKIIQTYGIPFDPSARHRDFITDFVSGASPQQIEKACSALGAMERAAPEEIAPAIFLGQILDMTGRSAEAIPHVRAALRRDSASAPIRLFLATALERADSLTQSRRIAEEILAADPQDAAAISILAMIERKQGHPGKAAELLVRAACLAPSDATILLRLGVVEAEAGRSADARRHMGQALRLRPGDPSILQNMRALDQIEAGRQR